MRPRPSVFFAGAPKSGSSALTSFLGQHPAISVPRVKEPNFLCRDLDLPRPNSEEEYLALFDVDGETELLLDASILYLYSRTAAQEIARYAPDARVLVMLRDPVAAMHAWHGQMVYTANEPLEDFAEALAAEDARRRGGQLPAFGASARCPQLLQYRAVMRYGEQLERLFAHVPRERVHVVLHDDFRGDPEGVLAGVLGFLGVDPSFAPTRREVNPAKVRRSPALHRALKRLLAAPARRLLPLEVRLRLIGIVDRWTTREQPRAPLDPGLAGRLRDECRPDVERLAGLIRRDLGAWCRP